MVAENQISSSVRFFDREFFVKRSSSSFAAIQFVLSDEFSNLSADARYNLMHEGINSRSLNAYVEIIFDNSDSRIMVSRSNSFRLLHRQMFADRQTGNRCASADQWQKG